LLQKQKHLAAKAKASCCKNLGQAAGAIHS
jgi:hypothetical protein